MRKVIIGGAGQVGFQIAKRLAAENYDVTVVDQDETLVAKVSESLDLRGVVGHASHPDILERAGARDTEILIAATASESLDGSSRGSRLMAASRLFSWSVRLIRRASSPLKLRRLVRAWQPGRGRTQGPPLRDRSRRSQDT